MPKIVVEIGGDEHAVIELLGRYGRGVNLTEAGAGKDKGVRIAVADVADIVALPGATAPDLKSIRTGLEYAGVNRADIVNINFGGILHPGHFSRLELYPDGMDAEKIRSAIDPYLEYFDDGQKRKAPVGIVRDEKRQTMVTYVPETRLMPQIESALRKIGYKSEVLLGYRMI